MDRVVVFVDYQNVQGWARRQFYSAEAPAAVGHVDPLRLARHIVRRRRRPSDLAQVRVYRGPGQHCTGQGKRYLFEEACTGPGLQRSCAARRS